MRIGLWCFRVGMVLTEKMSSLLVETRKKRIAGRGARRVITSYARDVDLPTAKFLQSLAGAAVMSFTQSGD